MGDVLLPRSPPGEPTLRGHLRIATGFFALATGLGALLRWNFLVPMPWLNFGHALHAHSHTLYFGWAALAIFALAFERVGRSDRAVRWLLRAIAVVAAASFISFLQGGYSRQSIIVSILSLFVWGWAVVLFLRSSRALRTLEVTFLRVAVSYVALAGASALARVVMVVTHADPLYGRLAVFGFLHNFANFFLLATLGLLVGREDAAGTPLDRVGLRRALGFLAPLMVFTFPLGVAGADELPLTHVARVVACVLLYPSALVVRALWSSPRVELRFLAALFASKALMEAAGAVFGLASALPRHATVLYLHVVLVGFVSGALVLLVSRRRTRAGFWAHQLGLGVMAVGLALGSIALPDPRPAMAIAAAGGTAVWLAVLLWA